MGMNKGLNDLSWAQTLLIDLKKYMEIENRCKQTERDFGKDVNMCIDFVPGNWTLWSFVSFTWFFAPVQEGIASQFPEARVR